MFDLSWEQNQSFGPTIASSVELEKILKVGKRYRGPFQLDFVSRREAGWSVECRVSRDGGFDVGEASLGL